MRRTIPASVESIRATPFVRHEPIGAYIARVDYVSSSTLRRALRAAPGSAPAAGWSGEHFVGDALHALLLEPHRFEEQYLVVDRDLPAHIDEAAFQDRVWVGARDYAALKAMRDAVLRYTRAPLAALLREGAKELSIYWSDDAGGRWKARPDCFTEAFILEVKTTTDVRPDRFARTRRRFDYDVQAAHYLEAVQLITGQTPRVLFVAVEVAAPHCVWAHELSPADLAAGKRRLAEARRLVAQQAAESVSLGRPAAPVPASLSASLR